MRLAEIPEGERRTNGQSSGADGRSVLSDESGGDGKAAGNGAEGGGDCGLADAAAADGAGAAVGDRGLERPGRRDRGDRASARGKERRAHGGIFVARTVGAGGPGASRRMRRSDAEIELYAEPGDDFGVGEGMMRLVTER